MNQRPSGYEPDELPDCSIPHQQSLQHQTYWLLSLVRKGALEPPRPKALPPQGSVSTNSTTTAAFWDAFYSFKSQKERINSTYSVVFGAFDEVSGDVVGTDVELCTVFKL